MEQIHYEYLQHPKKTPKPGITRQARISPPYAIEFVISISNIGTKEWHDDLNILYLFNEGRPFEQDSIIIKDLLIPYALNTEVIVEIKYPMETPKSITFCLNTTNADSIEQYKIYDEFFYNNNSITINLN
jgi:hypothetical protein